LQSAQSIATKEDINAKTIIAESVGSAAQGIVEYSEENLIDLIVVGTKGLTGLKRFIIGSVANALVQYAHCSVLVVR